MKATVSDVVDMMEVIAPTRLAEEWDNVGLQVGAGDWPVGTVWVSLDPRPDVVDQAAEAGADLLITHHPLLFKPLRSVDPSTPVGAILVRALASKTAIYAAHTNLDSAVDGLNDLLAGAIGLTDLRPLAAVASGDDAGEGLGRIGRLPAPLELETFARQVETALGVKSAAKLSGRADLKVETAAVCSGSGSSLMRQFLNSDAQVYVTGDLRYHDALDAQDADRGLVDIGHFASEAIVVDLLVRRLSEMARSKGMNLTVEPCRIQRDPFRTL